MLEDFVRITKETFASPKGKIGLIMVFVGFVGMIIINYIERTRSLPVFLTFLCGVTALVGVSTWSEAMTEIRARDGQGKSNKK